MVNIIVSILVFLGSVSFNGDQSDKYSNKYNDKESTEKIIGTDDHLP